MVDLFLRSYKLLSRPQVLGVTIESLVTATIWIIVRQTLF